MATQCRQEPVVSRKTVERLSRYRRLLDRPPADRAPPASTPTNSPTWPASAPAQVRRDFMVIGYSGSPNRGYQVDTCLASIEQPARRHHPAGRGSGRARPAGTTRCWRTSPAGVRCCASPPASTPTRTLIGTSVEGCPVHAHGRPGAGGRARRASGSPSSPSRRRPPRRSPSRWCGRACAASWTSPPSPCACRRTSSSTHGHHLGARDRPPSSPGRRAIAGATPTAENGGDNGAEAEMEPIITHHRLAPGGGRHEAGRTCPPDRRPGPHARGPRTRQDHQDLRRRPGERPAERGLAARPCWSPTWPTCRWCGWRN